MREYEVKKNIKIKSIMSAFEAYYCKKFFFGGENHNFWEMVYVIDGKIGVSADDKIHELSKDEVVFHKPMEFHKLWASSGTSPHLFIMSFCAEGDIMTTFENGVFQLTSTTKINMETIIELFRKQAKFEYPNQYVNSFLDKWDNSPISTQLIGNYFEIFLLSILDYEKTLLTEQNTQSSKLYKQSIEIMERNICKNLSVDDIADMCNASAPNLKKIFSRYSSYGIHKHFLRMKIIYSIELLKNGYSVAEISDLLSFNNQNYFSIVFKREIGYSPLNYKKYLFK